MAVGTACFAVPGAQALSISATTGSIALNSGSGVQTVQPDGSGATTVAGIPNSGGISTAWAPDGSRVVSGGQATDQLATARVTGASSPVTVGWPQGSTRGSTYQDAVYWSDGSYLLSSTGSELLYGPSDNSYDPQPLLTSVQEPAADCDTQPTTSPYGTVAFTRTAPCGAATSAIWTYDPTADTVTQLIANAADAEYSADGTQLVFTRAVDGVSQLFTAQADGSGVKQVSSDAADHLHPSWDPAGGRIAYDSRDTATGATTVRVENLADGSTSTISSTGEKPSWQPVRDNTLDRVYGTGAIGIDDAASRWTFDTAGAAHQDGLIAARSAVLVNKDNATYAAPAVSLAAEKQAPVLMTSTNAVDASVSAELTRSLPKGSTVYLVGGTNLLGTGVADQITALGYKALRLDGTDLAAVSARVATQITAAPKWVFVADGSDYHDPIAASTAAGALGYRGLGVVLLTRGTTIESSVQNYLNSLDPATTNLVTVGTNALTAMETTPLSKQWSFWDVSGSSNEITAVNLAKFWWAAPNVATVQDTWTWQNAVAGNAVTATYGPALWSTVDVLSSNSAAYLAQESASVQNVQTFGGNDAYSVQNRADIGNAIGISSTYLSTVWAAGGNLPAPAATTAKSAASPLTTARTAVPAAPASPAAPAAGSASRSLIDAHPARTGARVSQR